MSEPNFILVGFICVVIIVIYCIGFWLGQGYEQSKLKDEEKAKQAEKKKTGRGR